MALIEDRYLFVPTAFQNGDLHNEAGQNSGSCKLFAFAQLQGLDEQSTLHCFGNFYRVDVLEEPDGDSHQNIRNFIKTGWSGINFDSLPLKPK
jgi:hypothetical protein